MNQTLPKKLKQDAIVEAIVEIRFEIPNLLEEVVIGRLADCSLWADYNQRELPGLPKEIRRSDASLKYQPQVELISRDSTFKIRIGGNSVSIHNVNNYAGWPSLSVYITNVINHLFRVIENASVTRVGLRYINVFKKELHGISSMSDLEYTLSINAKNVNTGYNISKISRFDNFDCIMRLATSPFVNGPDIDKDFLGVVDIDVYTHSLEDIKKPETVLELVQTAHKIEKQHFFGLFTEELTNQLVEE